MKALDILNRYSCFYAEKFVNSGDESFKQEYENINKAIAELEAMMQQPQTCDGCKYFTQINKISVCGYGRNCKRATRDLYCKEDDI